jgi:hypothetical protein
MTSLRQRMTDDTQVRDLSPCTQAAHVLQISPFARKASGSARKGTAPMVMDDSRV